MFKRYLGIACILAVLSSCQSGFNRFWWYQVGGFVTEQKTRIEDSVLCRLPPVLTGSG